MCDFGQITSAFGAGMVFYSLFLGVACCLLPYLFYTKGMEKIDNGRASVLAMAEPLVAAIVSIFIDGMPGIIKVLGMFVMFGGIAFMSLKKEEV